jgi:CheY-like chemotaxis protein
MSGLRIDELLKEAGAGDQPSDRDRRPHRRGRTPHCVGPESAFLEGIGHKVVSIARTRKDAVKAAQIKKPGLVIADLRLADGSSGLDAVNDILRSFTVPVVFVTAFPERLSTGGRWGTALPHPQAVP